MINFQVTSQRCASTVTLLALFSSQKVEKFYSIWRFYESSHPIRDGETNIYLTFIFVFTESHQKSWFQKSNKSKDYSFFYTYVHFNFLSLREHFEFENLAWKKKWKEMHAWNFSKYWGDAYRRVLEVEIISSSLWHKFHSIDLANRLNE